MKYLKKLYGTTSIDSTDYEESLENKKIELEYYTTKNKSLFFKNINLYGIEVVEKYIKEEKVNVEKTIVNNIYRKEEDINKLLDILINNKVTPIAVKDVISDIKFTEE